MPGAEDHESVRPKRSCKDRPCDHCRRLKHTCTISVRGSRCANCVKGNRECTFTGPSVQRHRLNTASTASIREASVDNRTPRPSGGGLLDALEDIDGNSEGTDNEIFFRDLDEDLQDEEESHYLGSGFFSRDQLEGLEVNPSYRQVADPGRPVYFIRNPSRIYGYANSDFEAQRAYNAATSLLLQHGPLLPTQLTDKFIKHVLPAFPIMSAVRLEAACRGWQGGGQFPYAVLVGVFAFMSPSIPSLRPVCKDLWSFAVQLLDNEYRRPRLHTLQLALLDISGRPVLNSGGNHIALGRANGLAQLLGLHRDSSRWQLPRWERSLRKRICWTLYIQDRWNALIYDRPTQIDSTASDVPPVSVEDDDWGGQRSESRLYSFALSCRLAQIVDKLLPITQTFGIVSPATALLLDLSREIDQIVLEIKALPPSAPGIAALQLSVFGLSNLICRIASSPDPRDSRGKNDRRARKALRPVIRNIEHMTAVVTNFSFADLEGYWPIWSSHMIIMSISTALHLFTRIWQSRASSPTASAYQPPNESFDAINSLIRTLRDHAAIATDATPDSTRSRQEIATAYWEVAESVMARLPSITRSLPSIPGSEALRALLSTTSDPIPEPIDLLLDPLAWFNWITTPEGETGGA